MKKYVEMMKYFNKKIKDKETLEKARLGKQFFSRNSKLGYENLIKLILSRTGKTTSNEINNYYSELDLLTQSVSKQCIFQAREKLNPDVFRYLNNELITYYYKNNIVKKYKNHLVLAVDGTTLEMPLNDETTKEFGVNTSTKYITKSSPRGSGMYDVLNNIYLDFFIKHWQVSEIPMAYEQIKMTNQLLNNKNCIFLADRYYGATDLFLYFEIMGHKYCFRGKKNFYKHYLDETKRDSVVRIPLDDAWIKRLKIEESKTMASEKKELTLRVIRFKKSEITNKEEKENEEIILFTNLTSEEFSTLEIIELYGLRWKIETGYGVLKTKMELERVTSEKPKIILQDLYSQIIIYNQISILKDIADKKINSTDKYTYQVNINNLIWLYRKWLPKILNKISTILSIIEKIINKIIKNKEPIRKNRLYPRWNVYISKPVTLKFRVDGKRNPKVYKNSKGYIRRAT